MVSIVGLTKVSVTVTKIPSVTSGSLRTHVFIIMALATLATVAQAVPTRRMTDRSAETGASKPEHQELRHHRHHRHHRHRHHNKITRKGCQQGLGGFLDGNAHCCKNGGVPILGRCACPRNYEGQYCELRKRGCLEVPHGGVFIENCSLCTCRYGIVSCITRAFAGCANTVVEDDGNMKTYDLRSKKQKQAAVSELSSLLNPSTTSGTSRTRQYTAALAATWITTLTFLLCGL